MLSAVIRNFHISVLAANSHDELLEQQIRSFEPELAVLSGWALSTFKVPLQRQYAAGGRTAGFY